MQPLLKKYDSILAFWLILLMLSLSCKISGEPEQLPQSSQPFQSLQSPQIVLARLNVIFLGEDGHKVIGSGCPGTDGKGTIVDYHFIVSDVDEDKKVQRIIVAGDNSTLTWEYPCSNDWALSAKDLENGNWEIFIAPALPSKIYTVIFFYTDNTFALGMGSAP